jgi:CDP-diacylglycerol--serine O-phosphatidyltransferase
VISFGVAPVVLMVRAVMGAIHSPQVSRVPLLWRLSDVGVERVLWLAGAIYVAGAVMRLARFNVENEPDESAHMSFRGLPSPGAAAAVATLVLLFDRLTNLGDVGWAGAGWSLIGRDAALWIAAIVGIVLPVMTFAVGLLMVSNFQYPHVINQYIRGRKPFGYLVKLIVLAAAAMLEPFVAMALAATAYATGPALAAIVRPGRRTRPAGRPDDDLPDDEDEDASPEEQVIDLPDEDEADEGEDEGRER